MALQGSILGNPVKRKEDPGILTGVTEYFDDLAIEGVAHIAFVRSTVAHANVESIDTSEAVAMPGVVAVYTASTMEIADHNGFVMLPPTMMRAPLAKAKVRFVGDIVAAIVAESKAQAVDAAEAVIVDYEPLPAVADVEQAVAEGAVLIHEGAAGNIAFGATMMGMGAPVEGVLDDADVVVNGRFVNQRLAGVPMEPSGIIAVPEQGGAAITAWV